MGKKRVRRKNLKACGLAVSAVLLLSPLPALAAEAPDAGKTLEELKRPELNLPQKPPAEVRTDETAHPAAPGGGVKFKVNGFRITGQNVFSESKLLALLADSQGKELSLADLEKLAKRITDFYRARGYIVARAYIPAQHVENGIVQISVFTGRYDKIIIRNHAPIAEKKIARQLGKVKSGAFIEKKTLDKALWLIGDLAGVEAKATLAPGSKKGTSDLYIDVTASEKTLIGSIGYDNSGNRFTGKNQFTTAVTVLNPAGQGDQLSFYGITAGSGLVCGGVSYTLPTNVPGGKAEFGYSRLKYELGKDFASLDASGTADVVSLGYSYAFNRSRTSNLYAKLGFDIKQLHDSASGADTNKYSNLLTLTVGGDNVDAFGGGGANSYALSYSYGRLNADDANSVQASTPGDFGKWRLTASRRQHVGSRLELVSLFNGQLATKNLDSSEKMSLGGAYGVRAYPRGEASGDNAYILTNELRWTLPPAKNKAGGVLQLVAFHDIGAATINKDPWTGAGDGNHRTLQGAGVGLNWIANKDYSVKVSYAWKIGSEKAQSDTDKNGRLWLAVTKRF